MEPPTVELAKPGLEQQIKVVAHYLDGAVRDVTNEAVIASNIPDTADVTPGAVVKGIRTGEATMLVRYEGKFGTVPVTILNPETGLCLEAAAAEQLHRSAHRRETAEAQDSALARGGRRHFPAPGDGRPHRATSNGRRGARISCRIRHRRAR